MRELVAKGADLMDQRRPGWYRRTNVEELDMSNSCRCIGGQEDGMYSLFLDAMGLTSGHMYGFSLDPKEGWANNDLAWNKLSKLWVEEIEARLLRDELEAAQKIGVRTEEELALA